MNAQAFSKRCYVLTIVGQTYQALADCDESVRLQPNDADSLDSRGFAYLKLGQFDSAITDYDSVLSPLLPLVAL
jgi:regulator of sirC expression with transglutaminase-like and TPR domain